MSIEEAMLQMIYDLKQSDYPLFAKQTCEFFTFDNDFDIVVTLRLKKKKSQLEVGEEMFRGKAR